MTDHLMLRFEAPLMSFGGESVDAIRVSDELPATSMLTGLLANALGYERREFERLDALQRRLRYGVMYERQGEPLVDYQTVDLSHEHLVDTGWTTHGTVEERGGSSDNKVGTHIRHRHFRADAIVLVALRLEAADESPTLDELDRALREPERPLFLGRKACIPAAPVLVGRVDAASLADALVAAIPSPRTEPGPLLAFWPEGEGPMERCTSECVVRDHREHRNQIHVGRRVVFRGTLERAAEVAS